MGARRAGRAGRQGAGPFAGWLAVLLLAAVGSAGATADPGPTAASVSVTSGPTVETSFLAPCDDAVAVVDQATTFVLARTGELDPLEVAVRASGTAVEGDHVASLPATVTFASDAAEASIELEVLGTPSAELVELTLQVVDGDGYTPRDPDRATVRFVTPALGPPVECGFRIVGAPVLERELAVGGTPEPVVVEEMVAPAGYLPIDDPTRYRVTLVDGALPDGLTLTPEGRFTGMATRAGTDTATIEACRTEAPGSCVTAEVTSVVTATADVADDADEDAGDAALVTSGGAATELPATGAPLTALVLAAAGIAGAGATALRRGRGQARS